MVVKKFVYNFLVIYASQNPDIALLSVNTLSQECSDSNPMVRGMALKTLCSLNHESFVEYGLRAVNQGLSDKSAYVRRIAVTCCGRFYDQKVDMYNDSGLINLLYGMLRDSDPIVVVNAVMILEGILKDEGGIVINKKITHHLLNQVDNFTPWGQSYVFGILEKYQPKSEDEVFDIMNVLDGYLLHNNAAVSVQCLHLFLHLIQNMAHLKQEVLRRTFETLSRVFSHGNNELVYVLLEHIQKLIIDFESFLKQNHRSLYCKQREPVYLKLKKLEMLPLATTLETFNEVVEEVFLHGKSKDKIVSQKAIESIGMLTKKFPSGVDKVIGKLKHLLESGDVNVLSSTLQILQEIDLGSTENVLEIVSVMSSKLSLLSEEKGQMAFLTILYLHCNIVPDSPYIFEDFLENFENTNSAVIRCQALSTCAKIFFCYPATTQGILGRVLESCTRDTNAAVRDQALFYYSVLSLGPTVAESMLT